MLNVLHLNVGINPNIQKYYIHKYIKHVKKPRKTNLRNKGKMSFIDM